MELVQNLLVDELALQIIEGKIKEGSKVSAKLEKGLPAGRQGRIVFN